MAKLNYKEVVSYFDDISEDMAELVLSLVNENLDQRMARKAKISANLKKARAAKGKTGATEAVQTEQAIADPVVQSEVAAQIPVHRRPGRPPRVQSQSQPADLNEQLTREQSA